MTHSGSIIHWVDSKNSGEHHTYDQSLTVKDTHKMRSGREQSSCNFSLWNQGESPSQYTNVFTNQEAPLSVNVHSFY